MKSLAALLPFLNSRKDVCTLLLQDFGDGGAI